MRGINKPNLVDSYIIQGVNYRTVNFSIIDLVYGFEWDSVEIPMTMFNYAGIVDALVTYKYPNDKMQSVINNYLLESDNAEYIQEFNDMQAWRKEAKEIAKQALDYNNK